MSAWSKANPSLDVQPILAEIRLSLFTINDLLKVTNDGEEWWYVLEIYWTSSIQKKRDLKLASKGCPANRADASRRSTGRNPVEDRVTGYRAPI